MPCTTISVEIKTSPYATSALWIAGVKQLTGVVWEWKVASLFLSVSTLSSFLRMRGSPVRSSSPARLGGWNFSWYDLPLDGCTSRPDILSTCRVKTSSEERLVEQHHLPLLIWLTASQAGCSDLSSGVSSLSCHKAHE